MKRCLKVVILIVLALIATVFSACEFNGGFFAKKNSDNSNIQTEPIIAPEEPEEPIIVHEHTFRENWVYDDENHWHEATCEHTEEKDSLSLHVISEWIIDKNPTCNEDGKKIKICTVCNKIMEEVIIPAKGHSFSESWVYNEEYHWRESICNHKGLIDGYGEHEGGDWIIDEAPTCAKSGERHKECIVCGKIIQKEKLTPTGHTFSEDWTYDDSQHWHQSTCGHQTIKDSYSQHIESDWIIVVNPTCSTLGSRRKECSVCGKIFMEESIPYSDHVYSDEWSYDDDYHWRIAICEHTEEKINYELHHFDGGKITKKATGDDDGELTYTCVCGKVKKEIIPAKGHNYSTEWSSDGTYHWHKCLDEDCNSISGKETHVGGEWIITSNPTCTESGIKIKKCSLCEKIVEEESIEPLGHTYSSKWFYDDDSHWKIAICEHEGEIGELNKHKFVNGVCECGAIVYNVSIYVDGKKVYTFDFLSINKLTVEKFNEKFTLDKVGLYGYTVDKWYGNAECSIEFKFGNKLITDINLYGQSEYILQDLSFYNKIEIFEEARLNEENKDISTTKLKFSSLEELRSWIEYIYFFNLTENKSVYFELTYDCEDAGKESYKIISGKYAFPGSSIATVKFSEKRGKVYISKDRWKTDCTLVCDEFKEGVYAQEEYLLKLPSPKTRGQDYDNFNINKVNKTINVETSDQLYYVLQYGYNPICKKGSNAEIIYNKAKDVLREIISDDMDNITKLRMIYEWLITEVQYDHKATELIEEYEDSRLYDSWYAEGVFNNKVAVCDGITKAFLILARIEGIPCIRVTGSNHAWNKVYLDGKWYGIDATHGNVTANMKDGESYEVLTYRQFLFTDAFKKGLGYTHSDYTTIKATTLFNFYDYYENEDLKGYDLFIGDNDNTNNDFEIEELTQIINYIKSKTHTDSKYFTIDIAMEVSNATANIANIIKAVGGIYTYLGGTLYKDSNGNAVYVLFIENK